MMLALGSGYVLLQRMRSFGATLVAQATCLIANPSVTVITPSTMISPLGSAISLRDSAAERFGGKLAGRGIGKTALLAMPYPESRRSPIPGEVPPLSCPAIVKLSADHATASTVSNSEWH